MPSDSGGSGARGSRNSSAASASSPASASSATAISVGATPSRTRAPGRTARASVSMTTRSGCTAPGTPRTARCGSSVRAVPAPTSTASVRARSRCTSARASAEVIQRLEPSAAATRPSSVAAYFQITYGRRSRTAVSQAALTAAASAASGPLTTSTPASARRRAPPEETGSGTAYTTRAIPASRSAWAQGPVRPVWSQGSRVTTAVPPRASSPASARACTSACGPPARWCQPSPTTRPSASSTTQPTTGLGLVDPRPRAASPTARRMAARSAGSPAAFAAAAAASVATGSLLPLRARTPGRCGTVDGLRVRAHLRPEGGAPYALRRHLHGAVYRSRPAAHCLPSGLSPSVQEFHLVNRPLEATGSRTVTAGSDFHRPRSALTSLVRPQVCHGPVSPARPWPVGSLTVRARPCGGCAAALRLLCPRFRTGSRGPCAACAAGVRALSAACNSLAKTPCSGRWGRPYSGPDRAADVPVRRRTR
jgi:hypothetical protein